MNDLADVENAVNDVIQEVNQHEARKAAIVGNSRLSQEAKRADIQKAEEAFVPAIEEKQANARAVLDASRRDRQVALDDLIEAAKPRPADAGQWQEASARASFIREDLEKNPIDAPDMLRAAVRRNDTVAAYLIMRYAPDAISDNSRVLSEFHAVIEECYPVDSKKRNALLRELTQLFDLSQRLPLVVSDRQKTAFADAYGIDARFMP